MDLTCQSMDISAILEEEVVPAKPEHACCDCNFTTTDKSNLNKHIKRHAFVSGPEPGPGPSTSTPKKSSENFICDQCGKNYKRKYGLMLHVKGKHENTFNHICGVCGRGFNQRVQFRFHCSRHLNIGLDKCRYCKTEFSSHGSLKRHLLTCGSNCQQEGAPHMYRCDICQATFVHKHRLAYHIKGKHQPPRYSCNECGNRYAWRSSLKAHQKHGHKNE